MFPGKWSCLTSFSYCLEREKGNLSILSESFQLLREPVVELLNPLSASLHKKKALVLTCFTCCALASACIHSRSGSCTKVCSTVCKTSSFSLNTLIVVSQDFLNAPSTPVAPNPFTIFLVKRNGTTLISTSVV